MISYLAFPGLKWSKSRRRPAEQAHQIILAVSRHYGITLKELHSKSRRRDIVRARHEAMYFIRKFMQGVSLVDTAEYVGVTDHTTVIHAIRNIEKRREIGGYRAQLDELQAIIVQYAIFSPKTVANPFIKNHNNF